jgi:nucleotide-binding universal stress UspA family protein
MFRHVLVPLGSEFLPRETLMTAAVIATEQCAELTLVHVKESNEDSSRVERLLGDASAIVAEYGSAPAIQIARGVRVHKAIKAVATSLGVDVILMGTRRSRFQPQGYGGIVEGLLNETKIPLLMVHESPRRTTRGIEKSPR